MKTKIMQRRIKAVKRGSCGLCHPWKKGHSGKRTVPEIKQAVDADQQLKELQIREPN